MILTGCEILKSVKNGNITIDPFNEKQLNPNSYNFKLGSKLLVYEDYVLDARKYNKTREIEIPDGGITLNSGLVYLGHIEEIIGSDIYTPIIRGRSSIGRLGLFVNITSDLIDIGAIGQYTLQLNAVQPVTIYKGMEIGQVTFWKVEGDISLYNGKYNNLRGPLASRSHLDT